MNQLLPVLLVFATAFVGLSIQATITGDSYYNAGVVEFSYSTIVAENLKGFLEILTSQDAEDLDIIVFPEMALNNNTESSFVPNPDKEMQAPCDDLSGFYHEILIQLSCAARNTSKYIVVNLSEKELCSTVPEDNRPCATSGLNIFNTNVVFDRNGNVISRYRKVNLYGENKNTTFVPEFGVFDTDFGVRFGHFICFDILFYSPVQQMVVENGIKDFIFTTMWFSQLPFLTAVQIQQAWSYGNDVNLLAAGASKPSIGNTGSGIYNGRNGALVAIMEQGTNGVTKLYKAKVPKYQNQRHISKRSAPRVPRLAKPNIFLKRDYLQNYESMLVELSNGTSLTQDLCFPNSTFCCSFDLKWQAITLHADSQYNLYRLGVYDGLRNEEAAQTNELKSCAVFSCIGEDIMDCGKVADTNLDIIFENITITAKFPKAQEFLLMPNSLTAAELLPVPVSNFEWTETQVENNEISVRYSLNTTTSNILAFSIYGNYYDGNFDVDEDDAAATLILSTLSVISVILLHSIL